MARVYGPQRRPSSSGNFGPLAGFNTFGLTYQFDGANAARLARDLAGKFRTGGSAALRNAHWEMAARVRQYAADELREAKRRSGRPQRPDSLLMRSITDGRNGFVSPSGFQVGLEDWLFHQSPAFRYARRIELGGPNPMAAIGPITGGFWFPGGNLIEPIRGRRSEGRLMWRPVSGRSRNPRDADPFVIRPDDIVDREGGYHLHQKAGARFMRSRAIVGIYRREFKRVGIDLNAAYRAQYGVKPTNVRLGGSR